jgi:acetyltransferase-like isoleucine patch superfamily enzyme
MTTQPNLGAFGESSFLAEGAVIRRPHLARIGKHSNVDHGFYCTTALHVGDYCHIAAGVIVIGGEKGLLEMGHFSTLGAGSRVVCANDASDEGLTGPTIPAEVHAPVDARPVRLEPMAIVTTAVTIMPGVTLGMGCMVGAGAVVTRDVDPWTVVVGVPARPVRMRAREKLIECARRLGYEFGGG